MENNVAHFSTDDKCPICERYLDIWTEHWQEGEYPTRFKTRSWYACDHCETTFPLDYMDDKRVF